MTESASWSLGSRVSPILVGRDDALELANEMLVAALAGRGRLLLVSGEAGIGKTRLLDSIERRAVALGIRPVRGQSFPEDREVAAAPFLDLAATMSRTAGFGEVGVALAGRLHAVDADPGIDGPPRRRQLVLDVVDVLAAAASEPTLVAIENLTDADDLTLETLPDLRGGCRTCPWRSWRRIGATSCIRANPCASGVLAS